MTLAPSCREPLQEVTLGSQALDPPQEVAAIEPLGPASHRVAPATSPSVPSIAVPPPKMRRLRGRSYPRSLASELHVRVSPHAAQAWNNAPRYPVRTSIRDTVSTQSPRWHGLVYGNWGAQEHGSLSRCFHLSLCGRYGGYASQSLL